MDQSTAAYITRSLIAALEREPRVNLHQYPIQVVYSDGVIRLEGIVESIIAKRVAVIIARRCAGRFPVVDRLRVDTGDSHEDGTLRDHVINILLQEPVFGEYRVRVRRNGSFETLRNGFNDETCLVDIQVQDGIVILEGQMGSLTHRRLAEVLVWWTAGCRDVDNRIRVSPPELDNDGELTDAIRIVIEKDPLVHADQLSVSTRGNTVTLNGYTASRQEQKLAVLDTWYVPGVHEVIDRIQTWG
jgi:osmotically-inducible protein OsmY